MSNLFLNYVKQNQKNIIEKGENKNKNIYSNYENSTRYIIYRGSDESQRDTSHSTINSTVSGPEFSFSEFNK